MHLERQQPTEVKVYGTIAVHWCNVSMVAECRTASITICIQAPFATGSNIWTKHSNEIQQGFNVAKDMQSLPEIDNSISFLAK